MSVSEKPETRNQLRLRLRELRRELLPGQRSNAEQAVAKLLAEFVSSQPPGLACTYIPTDGELDLRLCTERLQDLGWRIFLPVIGDGRQMGFAEWTTHCRLEQNKFGILEPASPAELLTAEQMDLALIPCVAVDASGNRLGFGAGYYDRAFSRAELERDQDSSGAGPTLIGCAFSQQVVHELAAEPWDVAMDYILTETAITRSLPASSSS